MKPAPTLLTKNNPRCVDQRIHLCAARCVDVPYLLCNRHHSPGNNMARQYCHLKRPHFLEAIFKHLSTWGLPVIMVILGVVEFAVGLYENKWTKNERILDIICFIAPKFIIRPLIAYFGLKVLPILLPGGKDAFAWIPFWMGLFLSLPLRMTSLSTGTIACITSCLSYGGFIVPITRPLIWVWPWPAGKM